MSRSFKKNGIIKDKGLSRGEYNRRFRRVNRQRIKEGKIPKLMYVYEITNQYDVCDYKMYWDRGYFHRELLRLNQINRKDFDKRNRNYFKK
jgi:hypothetical protein